MVLWQEQDCSLLECYGPLAGTGLFSPARPQECEAHSLPPSTAQGKNVCTLTSTGPTCLSWSSLGTGTGMLSQASESVAAQERSKQHKITVV